MESIRLKTQAAEIVAIQQYQFRRISTIMGVVERDIKLLKFDSFEKINYNNYRK